MIGWPTVAELATHLNMTDQATITAKTAQLTEHLNAAIEHVSGHCEDGVTGDPAPAGLKLAVLHYAAHLWETQRTPSSRRDFYPENSIDPNQPRVSNYRRAMELMEPHRIIPVG